MKKKEGGADALVSEAETALRAMLKDVMAKPKAGDDPKNVPSLTDKMKVLDRVIKLAAIKAKLKDDEYGTGFFREDEEGT